MKIIACAAALAVFGSIATAQNNTADRTFLIVGEPNAAAWEMLIGAPADREASMSGAIERLGGEMLSYYWGLGDGKNYITVRMPDDPGLIQALYVTRLGDNLLSSYQMIELISSPDMAAALARVPEIKSVDDLK
jgi:hypothetical protein